MGLHFLCIGGWENPQLAGKAWMPYKMNAQSFARMRNQQSVHKRAKDARWRSHKVVMQGCIKTATQSRCTMQRHKWLSLHRCNGTNGCHCTDATTLTVDDLHGCFAPQPRLELLCGINGAAAPRPYWVLRHSSPIGFNSVLNIQN